MNLFNDSRLSSCPNYHKEEFFTKSFVEMVFRTLCQLPGNNFYVNPNKQVSTAIWMKNIISLWWASLRYLPRTFTDMDKVVGDNMNFLYLHTCPKLYSVQISHHKTWGKKGIWIMQCAVWGLKPLPVSKDFSPSKNSWFDCFLKFLQNPDPLLRVFLP